MNFYNTKIFESIIPQFKPIENSSHLIDARNFFVRLEKDVYDEIVQKIQEGKKYFIFHCYTETLILNEVNMIHSIIKKIYDDHQVNNFYFITGAVDVTEGYIKYCEDHSISVRLKIIETWYFETVCREHHVKLTDIPTFYDPCTKEKTFLCYNRKARKHRLDLLEKLLEKNLIGNSYFSFMDRNISKVQDYPLINQHKHLFPINFESGGARYNPITIIPQDHLYFKNSLFSVVTETIFTEKKSNNERVLKDAIFFSEKIFKPIIMLHPFILLARPYSLKKLRDRGYMTFDGIIDESYDSIEDDDERLHRVVKEIEKLAILTEYEKITFMQKVKSIVEHNQVWFFKERPCSNFSIQDFF